MCGIFEQHVQKHGGIRILNAGHAEVQRVGDFLRALDVEAEVAVVLELKVLDREMLRVEGVADGRRDLHRQFLHVEDAGLSARLGVHDPVFRARGRLPGIPELVRIAEPVRLQGGGEHHLGNAFLGELRGEVVVGPDPRGAGALCGKSRQQRQQEDEKAFHISWIESYSG